MLVEGYCKLLQVFCDEKSFHMYSTYTCVYKQVADTLWCLQYDIRDTTLATWLQAPSRKWQANASQDIHIV